MPFPYIDKRTGMRMPLPGESRKEYDIPVPGYSDVMERIILNPVTQKELDDDLASARRRSLYLKHPPPLKGGKSRRRRSHKRKHRKTRRRY